MLSKNNTIRRFSFSSPDLERTEVSNDIELSKETEEIDFQPCKAVESTSRWVSAEELPLPTVSSFPMQEEISYDPSCFKTVWQAPSEYTNQQYVLQQPLMYFDI